MCVLMCVQRGHVDVWGEGHVPRGCVHLKLPRIKRVCAKLKVDCADAMVGFEIKSGRSVPRFEGIVICAEFEDEVRAAYEESEQRARVRAEKRRMGEIATNWRRLVRGFLTHQRIMQQQSSAAGAAVVPRADDQDGGEQGHAAAEALAAGNVRHRKSTPSKAAPKSAAGAAAPRPHVHEFVDAPDAETGEWRKMCACGMEPFEHI